MKALRSITLLPRTGDLARGGTRLLLAGGLLVAMGLTHRTGAQIAAEEWLLVPGESAGPVSAGSSARDLRALLGEALVVDAPIDVGEGEIEPGTLLYPDDATRRLAILWHDVERRERPRRVIVCYQRDPLREEGEGCRWRTREGIGIGTRLSSLEVLNEGPFVLTGFEWDYSGTVISWEGGALEGVLNAGGWRSWIRLSPRTDAAGNWIPAVAYEEMDPLLGERDVSSAHPLMQRLDPGIYSIGFEIDR